VERGIDVVERALACARGAGAVAADAVVVESELLETRVRGREIDFVKQARERSLGLRAFAGAGGAPSGALASSSDLSPEAVERLAAQAVALARATAADPSAGLPADGFATDLPDLQLFEPGDHPLDASSRIGAARAAESAARAADARIANSEGSGASSQLARIAYGNSAGFRGAYESARHSLSCEPIARDAQGGMQRDYWLSLGRRWSGLEPPAVVGRRAAERALRRLGARRVPTCEAAVLFDPVTAPSLVRQLASCLSGYAVYRGASYLAGKLGERVASEHVTLIDDGRLPGGLGSKPFDGEGLPTRRNRLVERGRLCSYLLDTYAGRKLGLASTGNAARGPASAPTAAPTNLWLEPGSRSPEQIVASTERGLLVTELIGMGFNPVTGDYSRGAAGLWIERGEIAYAVQGVTIAGNLAEMLAAVDAVGSDLLWLGATAAPTLRVARMTIAGD
jgi:PmbA protein